MAHGGGITFVQRSLQWTRHAPCSPLKGKKVKILVTQLCPTLCNPVDCSPPGSSIHGILQSRILEWVVIFFSRGSFWPKDPTQVSWITSRFFTVWVTKEALTSWQIEGEKGGSSDRLYFLGLQKSLWMVTAAMKLKEICSLEGKLQQI